MYKCYAIQNMTEEEAEEYLRRKEEFPSSQRDLLDYNWCDESPSNQVKKAQNAKEIKGRPTDGPINRHRQI